MAHIGWAILVSIGVGILGAIVVLSLLLFEGA